MDLYESEKLLQQESQRVKQCIRALEREKESRLIEHMNKKAGLQKELEDADNHLKYQQRRRETIMAELEEQRALLARE